MRSRAIYGCSGTSLSEQERDFFESTVLGQLLDEDAAILQDSLFAVDEADGGLGRRDVFKTRDILDHVHSSLSGLNGHGHIIERQAPQATVAWRNR